MKRHNRGRAGDMRRTGSLVLSFLARVNTNSQCHCTPESDTWIGEPRICVYSPTRWLRSNRPYHVNNMSLVPGLQIYMYSPQGVQSPAGRPHPRFDSSSLKLILTITQYIQLKRILGAWAYRTSDLDSSYLVRKILALFVLL
jgi:hypothetical protein